MILSDFPVFLGVKWIKYSCNAVTTTTYDQKPPEYVTQGYTPRSRKNSDSYSAYTGYTFSEKSGFEGTGHVMCRGNALSGYYEVGDVLVVRYDNETDGGNGNTNYQCPIIAEAYAHSKTTYSKGGTGYGAVYADKDELPDDGQLIEGSANDSYCVIKVDGTIYYYEKEN
jgi:hypothetical protein